MVLLQELVHFLEAHFAKQGAPILDYCINGVQVQGKAEIKTLACSVSASLASIEKAVALGVDALLVHHGVFWNKEPLKLVGSKAKKIELLLRHGISLIAFHLPLDKDPIIGNNWPAAKALGLENCASFEDVGVIGELSRPLIPYDFQKRLEDYYQHPAAAVIPNTVNLIKRVALISGGAHRSIEQAIQQGADAFVTGTHDEPIWHIARENQINFFAMGHYATEVVGPSALNAFLHKKFKIPCHLIIEENPF